MVALKANSSIKAVHNKNRNKYGGHFPNGACLSKVTTIGDLNDIPDDCYSIPESSKMEPSESRAECSE